MATTPTTAGRRRAGSGDAVARSRSRVSPAPRPRSTFDGESRSRRPSSEVVTEGDGDEIDAGDQRARPHLDRQRLQPGAGLQHVRRGPEAPQLLTADEKVLKPALRRGHRGPDGRLARGRCCHRRGGLRPRAGNAQLGIGNKDTVVAVIDLVSAVADGPEGEEQPAPSWAPEIVEKDGDPSSLDFSKAAEAEQAAAAPPP